jgi:UDP-N-acetylmuramoylalanine--D-glutamate ligase
MTPEDLLVKKILIWGYGLEGKACLKFLLEHGVKNSILVANAVEIKEHIDNVNFILESDVLKYDFDMVVKSPGVSIYKDEIKILQNKGVLVTSILNILLAKAQNIKSVKIIAITGSKGKSTACAACSHILKNLGYKVALVGNIGTSFLDYIDNLNEYDYLVMELSSYQTTNMLYNVDYSVVLNLFKEHVDWHGNHDNYFRDKMNINNFSKNRIVNFENSTIKQYLSEDINYVYFNDEKGFHLVGDFIYNGNKKLFDTRIIDNIKGQHIFKNLNAVFTVLNMENIDLNKAFESLGSFGTLEHRMEVFYENKECNIIFVNDSISTIPEATIECLKTFDKYSNVRLALGGFERKQEYRELIDIINKNKNIKVYLLGSTGKKLANMLNNCVFFDSFDVLITEITKEIENNTAVILSPASASYDMFKNFGERGKIFKDKTLYGKIKKAEMGTIP